MALGYSTDQKLMVMGKTNLWPSLWRYRQVRFHNLFTESAIHRQVQDFSLQNKVIRHWPYVDHLQRWQTDSSTWRLLIFQGRSQVCQGGVGVFSSFKGKKSTLVWQRFPSLLTKHFTIQCNILPSAFLSCSTETPKALWRSLLEAWEVLPIVSTATKWQKTGGGLSPFKTLLCLLGKFNVKLHVIVSDAS